ncbi:MAG: ribbon-helix-helix domain-containing protein [Syntrophales bacterium]|jgi:predicted transcriptional regulator
MKRKQFTTTIDEEALKKIKILAITLDRSVNDLLEEAIKWLLNKYEKPSKASKK